MVAYGQHAMANQWEQRAARVRILLTDCDGVLTDGKVQLLESGDEQKSFDVRDGHGIKLCERAGVRTGVISGRESSAVERRAKELGMRYLYQGQKRKIDVLDEILNDAQATPSECAFIGDDHADIPIMRRVGFAVAVRDAVQDTKDVAHFVTSNKGGCGAVREICEIILKARGLWDAVIEDYFFERTSSSGR